MSALDLWVECRTLAVKLAVNEGRLSYRGPTSAVERLLPELKKYKPELLACVAALAGLPVEDGPFMPWVPYMKSAMLKQWQRDLFEAVDALAKLEGWPDDQYDLVIEAIERQPVSTLRPDLAYFTERLTAARLAATTCKRRFHQ